MAARLPESHWQVRFARVVEAQGFDCFFFFLFWFLWVNDLAVEGSRGVGKGFDGKVLREERKGELTGPLTTSRKQSGEQSG